MEKKNKTLYIVGGLIVLCLGLLIAYFMFRVDNLDEKLPNMAETLSSIEGYGYTLEDRDTAIFKENFEDLKKVLSASEVNYKDYAINLSILYVIDLYTISNKINKYDVGGLEYIFPDSKENYALNVEDTLYKYVEDNSYGKRDQELPEVSNVTLKEIDEKTIDVMGKKYDGYTVILSWEYKKDLGYDSEATINVIKDNDKMYITSQSVSE